MPPDRVSRRPDPEAMRLAVIGLVEGSVEQGRGVCRGGLTEGSLRGMLPSDLFPAGHAEKPLAGLFYF